MVGKARIPTPKNQFSILFIHSRDVSVMSLRAEMRVAPAGVRQAQPGVATGQSVLV
jgi:hypothetical protein